MVSKARVPKSAIVVALSAATLGVIYGYDGSNIAGAQLYFEQYFGLGNDSSAIETIVTATVYGELIGALAGGFIINRFGRKPTIVSVAVGYMAFCLLSALAASPLMLGISRFFLGLTIGVSLIAVPIFVAESVPARIRGATLVAYQVACVVGIILGGGIDAGTITIRGRPCSSSVSASSSRSRASMRPWPTGPRSSRPWASTPTPSRFSCPRWYR